MSLQWERAGTNAPPGTTERVDGGDKINQAHQERGHNERNKPKRSTPIIRPMMGLMVPIKIGLDRGQAGIIADA